MGNNKNKSSEGSGHLVKIEINLARDWGPHVVGSMAHANHLGLLGPGSFL